MRKRGIKLLVLVALISALGGVVWAAVTEAPAPQVQTAPPLAAAAGQPGKPAWLTPEKEAALVEVRKILQEARQVAEGIELPNRLLTDRHKLKAMERIKARLLEDIQTAQLRAGEFPDTVGLIHRMYFAWALANYGRSQEAVQAASQENLADDGLLVLVDLLSKTGDTSAARQAVEASTEKEPLRWWRDRKRAVAFALLAQRQREQGDLGAEETLQRAMKAAQAIKVAEDRYRAFIHVGRAQAALGNQASSTESFREAKQATMGIREGGPTGALLWIAKAQAEAGDQAGSEQTFQQALELAQKPEPDKRAQFMGCLAWVQKASGYHHLAKETLQLALKEVESLSPSTKNQVLSEVGKRQLALGDREAVVETVQRMLKDASSASDSTIKDAAESSARVLARQAGDFQLTMELVTRISNDDWGKSIAISHLVRALVKTRDPFGTPEIFQQLLQIAARLEENHLNKDVGRRDLMLSSIAVVKAAVGNVSKALQTADRINSLDTRVRTTYGEIISLLMEKQDVEGAMQVMASIEEKWFPLGGSAWVLGDFAKAYAIKSEGTAVFLWARQQANPWAQAHALLGVAQGLMDRHYLPAIEGLKPAMPVIERCP